MSQGELTTANALPVEKGIAAAYRDYIAFLDATPRTVQTYTGNIRQFIKWLQRNGIQRPTRPDVIAYRDELRGRCKPSTVQSYITALRLFFSWTAQIGAYPNIAEHVKGAKLDSSHKKDYLNAGQIKDILDSIDTRTAKGKRDYSMIALMVTGGLRDIEVSRANVEDLKTLGGSTVLYLQGKGRDERTEYVKVVPAVERPLREYLRTRPEAKGKQPLFTSLSNNSKGERLSPKSISESFYFFSMEMTIYRRKYSMAVVNLNSGAWAQILPLFLIPCVSLGWFLRWNDSSTMARVGRIRYGRRAPGPG